MHHQSIGKIGEYYASQYLQMTNHNLLTKNFHSPFGEIDLITFDSKTNQLVFSEVKTRTSNTFGHANQALTARKIKRFLKTIFWYLQNHHQKQHWRMDFLALQLKQDLTIHSFSHFQNVLNEPHS